MGIFSSRTKIKCPKCGVKINIKEQQGKTVEILGKDMEGYIHLKHLANCNTQMKWDTLWGKVLIEEDK